MASVIGVSRCPTGSTDHPTVPPDTGFSSLWTIPSYIRCAVYFRFWHNDCKFPKQRSHARTLHSIFLTYESFRLTISVLKDKAQNFTDRHKSHFASIIKCSVPQSLYKYPDYLHQSPVNFENKDKMYKSILLVLFFPCCLSHGEQIFDREGKISPIAEITQDGNKTKYFRLRL